MANLAELALTEAFLKSLAKTIDGELGTVKEQMQAAMTSTGASQARAVLPDGTRVATTSLSTPPPAARVTDEAVFVKWVRQAAPAEVVTRTVEEVRPAYAAMLLEQMTAAGCPEVVDPATGEIAVVPGVEISASRKASHSVRLAKDGAERIVAAWRAGELNHLNLPQLGSAVGGAA